MLTSATIVIGSGGDSPVQGPSTDVPSVPPKSRSGKGRARARSGRRDRKRLHGGISSSEVIPTLEGGPSLEAAEGEALGSRRRKNSKKIIDSDLTPEERAIPDTPLLHNLGKHPSVYARAGRGTVTQNLNF